jgi:hypothetical protein
VQNLRVLGTGLRAVVFGLALSASLASVACGGSRDEDASSEGALSEQITLNPALTYDDRYKVIEILKKAHPTPPEFGDPRDGILAITRWQKDSGRGEAERDGSGTLTSWWSIANHHLPVGQLIALKQRGELPNVTLNVPHGPEWDLTPEEISRVYEFYDAIDAAWEGTHDDSLSQADRDRLERNMRVGFWTWHDTCLKTAEAKAGAAFSRMPSGEQRYARVFSDAFEPIASALNAPPHELDRFVPAFFPPHIVTDSDWSDPENMSNTQVTFLKGMGPLEFVELKAPFVHHPIRNTAARIGSTLPLRTTDAIFDRVQDTLLGGGSLPEAFFSAFSGF